MKLNLLLLHGALGSKKQLQELKIKLSSQFNVYDLNFDGHGDIKSNQTFSIDLFTENVIKFLAENNITQTNIFGYSMGGYVALNTALKAPHLVNKIFTLGTKFDWSKEAAAKEIKMLNTEKIEEKIPHFAKHLESIHTTNYWKDVVNKTANMMLELGNGKKLNKTELVQIQHKIIIGIGDQDHMVSIEESKENANTLPNGKLKIIKGFVHPLENNDNETLNSLINNFLTS